MGQTHLKTEISTKEDDSMKRQSAVCCPHLQEILSGSITSIHEEKEKEKKYININCNYSLDIPFEQMPHFIF